MILTLKNRSISTDFLKKYHFGIEITKMQTADKIIDKPFLFEKEKLLQANNPRVGKNYRCTHFHLNIPTKKQMKNNFKENFMGGKTFTFYIVT